jgi:hypothetical protein
LNDIDLKYIGSDRESDEQAEPDDQPGYHDSAVRLLSKFVRTLIDSFLQLVGDFGDLLMSLLKFGIDASVHDRSGLDLVVGEGGSTDELRIKDCLIKISCGGRDLGALGGGEANSLGDLRFVFGVGVFQLCVDELPAVRIGL